MHRTLQNIAIKIRNRCSHNIFFKLILVEATCSSYYLSWQKRTVAGPCTNPSFNATLPCCQDVGGGGLSRHVHYKPPLTAVWLEEK